MEVAAAAAVDLGGLAALGGFVDVVDLEAVGDLVAEGVEAGAVADLDGPAQRAAEEPALGADVDDP